MTGDNPESMERRKRAVAAAAAASGVPASALHTHADLFPCLDRAPYDEMVTLVPGYAEFDPLRLQWERYLWRAYYNDEARKAGRPEPFPLPEPPTLE